MAIENVELMHEHLHMGAARMKEDKETEEELTLSALGSFYTERTSGPHFTISDFDEILLVASNTY